MVFKGIKRFWRIICFFMRAKKKWRRPRKSDLLIYDAVRIDTFLRYLNPWHPEVLHLRGEQINVRVLVSSLFRSGGRLNSYIECFIEAVRPRLVVTFVDNNVSFYTISQKYPEVKTLFVQNGLRTYDLKDKFNINCDIRSKFYVDYMLVFGECVGLECGKLISGEVVPMGSLVNNLVRKESRTRSGVMAFLSQWEPCEDFMVSAASKKNNCSYEGFYWNTDSLIFKCLMRYAKEKNKQLMIIPRHRKGSDKHAAEKTYFRDLMDSEPEYLEPEVANSGYQAVDSAEVTVSAGSTLGYEAIARGNKVATFSIRLTFSGLPAGNFGWPGDFPDEGLFWTNNPDPDSFVRILDYLFEVDDAQWRKDIRASKFPSIMAYDPENSTLTKTFERVLGVPLLPELYP
jgi:surface carbohydrate biosynthesis protein